jgi:hypothetical protein
MAMLKTPAGEGRHSVSLAFKAPIFVEKSRRLERALMRD